MITGRQIREYLQAKPFRLFLSDGSSHEVPHPEFAWVFGSTLFVGVAGALLAGQRQLHLAISRVAANCGSRFAHDCRSG